MDWPKGLIIGASGVRGIVGETLTPEVVLALARAFGTYMDGQSVVLGRDSRASGEMLRDLVAGGLASAGCSIYHLSIAATPTVGVSIPALQAAGGIQITASHNPAPYNGLKFFGADGMVLPPAAGQQVLELCQQQRFKSASYSGVGQPHLCRFNPSTYHLQRILQYVDAEAIRKRRFRVFLDANHGAGGPLALLLLSTLGCEVVRVGCQTDGHFEHEPEPLAENLGDLPKQVAEENCQIGFVLDPDADRLALIDETGHYIGEEWTLALACTMRLRQQRGLIVVNLSTSRLIEDIAARHGVEVVRTPVGEVHVARTMREQGALLGGEGNGGVIDPRIGWVRDPFVAMALVLQLLAEENRPLSSITADWPHYTMIKMRRPVLPESLPEVYRRLQSQWPEARVNRADGLRLDWPDRWVHIRPSNTEPIVRIIAEAVGAETARQLAEAACAAWNQ
ncbi:MAG: phosphoglucosamine mutase [Gemmataceae bacterium]